MSILKKTIRTNEFTYSCCIFCFLSVYNEYIYIYIEREREREISTDEKRNTYSETIIGVLFFK